MKNRIEEIKKNMPDNLRQNAVPYAITGLSIATSIGKAIRGALEKPEPVPPTLKERAQIAADEASEKAAHLAVVARQKAKHAAEVVTEKAAEAKQSLADTSETAKEKVARAEPKQTALEIIKEHPFLVGSGVLATGFIAGLLIPPTRKEKQWFGDKGREIIDDAKAVGQGAVSETKAIAKETLAAADHAVREAAEDTGEAVRSKLASA